MNLVETPGFGPVYKIEITDDVIGGIQTSIDNLPHLQLANRTAHLQDRADFLLDRTMAALRMETINPIIGAYNVVTTDVGTLLSVHDPATASFILPSLATFPKNNPVSIVIADNGSTSLVPLIGNGSEIIEDVLNEGGGNVYYMKPGTRIVFIATTTSWVVVLKTAPLDPVFGFLPGDIATSASPSLSRTGFLLCDGQLILRNSYPNLFAAIGVTYGAGDGITNFRIPDQRDMFLRVWNGGAGIDPGRVFGTVQNDELKAHNHSTLFETRDLANFADVGVDLTGPTGTGPGSPPVTYYSNMTGGSETRPVNMSVNTFIKY